MTLKSGGFKELERIDLWFLMSILHLPNSAVGMAVCGELGQLYTSSPMVERENTRIYGIACCHLCLITCFLILALSYPFYCVII